MRRNGINPLSMPKSSQNTSEHAVPYNHVPVRVSEKSFNRYFRPFLSLPERSRKPKVPLWKIFNYILYQLHTGCQWYELPIDRNAHTGKPEIHYTSVWKWFRRWGNDRSLEVAFVNSVKELRDRKKLKLGQLHGDGTNTVAKKGVKSLGILATNIRKVVRL